MGAIKGGTRSLDDDSYDGHAAHVLGVGRTKRQLANGQV